VTKVTNSTNSTNVTRSFRLRGTLLALAALLPAGCALQSGHAAAPAAATSGAPSGAATGGTARAAAAPHSTTPSGSPAPGTASASSSAAPATSAHPLAGRTVVIDPGHNPGNVNYPDQINALVDVGNGSKACDTTGTSTDAGYSEADFTLDVARRARALLQAEGATVVFTQDGNLPWGPCVDKRAAIGNAAHADAAISIHGDGGPASGYGFHVILPAKVVAGRADTTAIVAPSRTLGLDVRAAFTSATGEPYATYLAGGTGLDVRDDLGGLNLSKVPKVFIECGNMRNAADAARMTSAAWRQRAAQGLAAGLTQYLEQAR
jgi:N-acetylmuramoyl-L-alanine amidase